MKIRSLWCFTAHIWGAIFLFAAGCSSQSPVANELSPINQLTSRQDSSAVSHMPALWGYWQVSINPLSKEVEIIPLRSAELSVNVTTFLQPPAGKLSNLGIILTDVSKWMSEGKLTVDVRLTHPFPGLHQYTGHDVRGIFIAPGEIQSNFDSAVIYTSLLGDQPRLLNADGCTRWWNPLEFPAGPPIFSYIPGKLGTNGNFNATINPYKYFAEGLGADENLADYFSDPANIANRGQFRAGSALHRIYDLQFPMPAGTPVLIYQYAVLANWVMPTQLNPNDLPGSFPPEANAYEPVNLKVTDNSTLYYTGSQSGGDISLDLDIYCWPVSAGANLLERINRIVIESPGNLIPSAWKEFDSAYILANSGPGSAENSSVVSIEIPNCTPGSVGTKELLIIIETDSDYSNDGLGANYPDAALSSYFLHFTQVSNEYPYKNPVVTAINPNSANQHSFVDNAVISGLNFINIVSVRLEKGAKVIQADSFTVDSPTKITADFNLLGSPHGLYDVVVEATGGLTGKLAEGFQIIFQCGKTAPPLDKTYKLDPQTNSSYVCAVLNAGPYKNYTIYGECNVISQSYRVFNHMTQADNTPIINWPAFGALGNPLCIEPANNNGLIIIQPAFSFSNWQVVNQTTGALLQNLPHGGLNGIVGDFDGSDNFWGISHRRLDPTNFPNVYNYYLQVWKYNPATPSTPYSFFKEYDVTSLFADQFSPDVRYETFGDLVILPDASYCFVLTGATGDDHKVDKVDLTGAAPVIVASYSFAGENLHSENQITIAQSRMVKMELDTSNADYIPCRLIVAGTKSTVSGDIRYLTIYRFDTNLNLFNKVTSQYNIASGNAREFYGLGMDMENKVLVHLTEFPSTSYPPPPYYGYYGITKLPADW